MFRGSTGVAKAMWEKGIELGHGSAAFNLGLLLKEQGADAGAKMAWRRGKELGNEHSAQKLREL